MAKNSTQNNTQTSSVVVNGKSVYTAKSHTSHDTKLKTDSSIANSYTHIDVIARATKFLSTGKNLSTWDACGQIIFFFIDLLRL